MNHMVAELDSDPYSPINAPEFNYEIQWTRVLEDHNMVEVGLKWQGSAGSNHPLPYLPTEVSVEEYLDIQDPKFHDALEEEIEREIHRNN